MNKKRISIIAIATFICLMTLGVLPVSAQALPSVGSHGILLAHLFPSSITIHTSSPRFASPQTPVGGGCNNYAATNDPVLFQSCISINGTPAVVPDAYITSDGSANWKACTIGIGMYYSTDGKTFYLEPGDPVGGNCLPALQNGYWGHLVGNTRPPQNIHEYYTHVVVIVTTTQHHATYTGDSKIQYCC